MTTLTSTPPAAEAGLSIQQPRLPGCAPVGTAVASVLAAGLLGLALGWGLVLVAVAAAVVNLAVLQGWSRAVESRRVAVDRLVTTLVWYALLVALVPLGSLVWTVWDKGHGVISGQFFTYSMRNVVGEGGGIYHAIMGTLLITAATAVVSIPIGILAAIYLVEYGGRSPVGRTITFLVDVMTGIPSIVAGLFAYALFALIFGPGIRMGFGGAIALSLLMVPVVVRSTEEMLKLVPTELREASYALGVAKWRTVVSVVLPTAMAGIITGVFIALARVIGETAPLLIIAGSTDSSNFNLFSDSRMMTLPVFIYYSLTQPGVPPEFGVARAWGAALVLIIIVMTLNLLARLAGRLFAPKMGR
ncbi:phosphate ABC transporter permease PstA [Nocardioides marmoribigeumensis]|uniref:Phosphate transport system permease protein PstA n=1 Tax=Nocardioides marmoribigeumensis TaxID=433649 RepID=A0ABU2BV52_9ACTN|nr:phosphate ABC transporter permease PstA [Nocardioides marmoribigeumensis]MDR7362136.1 phosphate transport system permease protein [Nocardioides marmoribigeumensis]